MHNNNNNIKEQNNRHDGKTLKAVVLLTTAAVFAFPANAFAATMTVTQQGYSGGTNPASHVTVTDASGAVVAEQDYAGGEAGALTFELDPGEYYVDATADGYDFVKQGGQLTEAGANVSLTAKAVSSITVKLQADDIDDFSGITVSLYSGTDTSGEPKASAVTNSSGEVVLEGVPAGDYTVVLTDIPENIAAAGLPTSMPVSVNADGSPATLVIAPEAGAETAGDQQEGTRVIAAVHDEEGNAVAGVQLSLMKDGTSMQSATTGSDGTASFNGVEDGEYTVEVQRVPSGYAAPESKTVTVSGDDATVEFVLTGSAINTSTTDVSGVPQTGDEGILISIISAVFASIALAISAVFTNRKKNDR